MSRPARVISGTQQGRAIGRQARVKVKQNTKRQGNRNAPHARYLGDSESVGERDVRKGDSGLDRKITLGRLFYLERETRLRRGRSLRKEKCFRTELAGAASASRSPVGPASSTADIDAEVEPSPSSLSLPVPMLAGAAFLPRRDEAVANKHAKREQK